MMRRPPRSTLSPYTPLCRSRPVAGLVEVEEEAPVVLYEVDAARQPPPGTPVAERGVPLGPRAGMAGQFGRFQPPARRGQQDRKSTRLNSSHLVISYAVLCLI